MEGVMSIARVSLPRVCFLSLALAGRFLWGGLSVIGAKNAHAASTTNCLNARVPMIQLSGGALRAAVACLINEERAQSGLRPLTVRKRLYKPARRHNSDMQRHIHHMSHTGSNGSTPVSRIQRAGYMHGARRWEVGEIIGEAWGSDLPTPFTIMSGWLNSPPHNHIIHIGRFRDFGVAAKHGTAENPNASGGLYTVDFGYRSPSL
jgi:uncharacterized protein YkwD